MKYHWIKDRQEQKEFQFHWKPGNHNLADPFIKHQAGKEHLRIRKYSICEELSIASHKGSLFVMIIPRVIV